MNTDTHLIKMTASELIRKLNDLPPETKIPTLYLLLNYLETIIIQKNEIFTRRLLFGE